MSSRTRRTLSMPRDAGAHGAFLAASLVLAKLELCDSEKTKNNIMMRLAFCAISHCIACSSSACSPGMMVSSANLTEGHSLWFRKLHSCIHLIPPMCDNLAPVAISSDGRSAHSAPYHCQWKKRSSDGVSAPSIDNDNSLPYQ